MMFRRDRFGTGMSVYRAELYIFVQKSLSASIVKTIAAHRYKIDVYEKGSAENACFNM